MTLAIRPESLGSARTAEEPFTGRVEDVSFLGSIVRVRLSIGGESMVSFDTFNDPNIALPSVGETVTVSFEPQACLVVGSGPAPDVDVVAEV